MLRDLRTSALVLVLVIALAGCNLKLVDRATVETAPVPAQTTIVEIFDL